MNSNDRAIRKYYCPLDNKQCDGCAGDSACGYRIKEVIENEPVQDKLVPMFIAIPTLFFALLGTIYMVYYIVRMILWLY